MLIEKKYFFFTFGIYLSLIKWSILFRFTLPQKFSYNLNLIIFEGNFQGGRGLENLNLEAGENNNIPHPFTFYPIISLRIIDSLIKKKYFKI